MMYFDNVTLTLNNVTLTPQKPCQHHNTCNCNKTNGIKWSLCYFNNRKSEIFSKSWQSNYQNFPCDLTKKIITGPTLCGFVRKLQAFEILNWALWSQWRKQRTSNFTREMQLIFSRLWNTIFYFFTAVKYSFFFAFFFFKKNMQCI